MTDIDEKLRRLGDRLDEEAPPISAAEVVNRADHHPYPRQRWVAPATVAASIVLLVGVGLFIASTRDDGRSDLVTKPAGPSTTATTSSTTTTAPTTSVTSDVRGGLPGERQEIYPYEGARLAVVGVASGDGLNVRAGPGSDYLVVFVLEPLFEDARATGHNRLISGRGYWSEIRVGERSGWVNTDFVLQPGQVDDVTSRLYPAGVERPSGSLGQLATAVATRARGDEITPKVVIVDGPSDGEIGEVAVDILGVDDDSVGGFRLRIFAAPTGQGTYTVRNVEQTLLCTRGVTDDGLCL